MTMTTHLRFYDPVDPRAVWEYAKLLVHAPEPFLEERHSAGSRPFEGAGWICDNAEIHAIPGQGADALIWLFYGPEGSLLNDSEYDDPEMPDYQRPPPAYVELCFDQPYSMATYAQHDAWVSAFWVWKPYGGRMAWYRGEDCTAWMMPSSRRPMPR